MSVAEIKQEVGKLGRGEILHLAAYLKHLSRRSDPAYACGLDATWDAMSAGDKISLGEYKKVSEELRKSGV